MKVPCPTLMDENQVTICLSPTKRSSPDNMRPSLVTLTKDVEQEQVHIVEQRLVVQEQLGQIAQVLAEHLFLLAINLKHGHIGIAVDLVTRWVLYSTPLEVVQHLLALLEKGEVVLTEVEHLHQHMQTSLTRQHDHVGF